MESTNLPIKRRSYLSAVVVTPLTATRGIQIVSAMKDPDHYFGIARHFFDPLRDSDMNSQEMIVGCANELCRTRRTVSEQTLESVINGSRSADNLLRRLRIAVGIFNEFNITTIVSESMVEVGERELRTYTRFIPLVGSFNNLLNAACQVSPNEPETLEDFLYASLAFGLEVALWAHGAPYKMAWRGTRFISNRTFLRFARFGCHRCIALVMSELHWALRNAIYAEVVSKDRMEFVLKELRRLQRFAEERDYEVDIEASKDGVERVIQEGESREAPGGSVTAGDTGPLGGILPDLPELEVPDLSDFFSIQ